MQEQTTLTIYGSNTFCQGSTKLQTQRLNLVKDINEKCVGQMRDDDVQVGQIARDENEKHGLRFFRREKRTNVGRID